MAGADGQGQVWRTDSRRFRLWAAFLLLLFAAYSAAYLWVSLTHNSPHPFGDSFAVWSWAHIAVYRSAAFLYDPAVLHAAQIALGVSPADYYPYVYPPSYLLALWPVGMLPYAAGSAAFIAATLALYLWATVGRGWRSPALAAALVLPTTTIAVVSGQSGFLTAALLAGGLRLAGSRPILSGVLFGLLTYKPQLGLLVPVALVSARLWRPLAAAAATALAMAFVTSLLFGWGIWPDWLAALPAYSREFAAESRGLLHLMPTVFANLLRLGIAPQWARAVQGAATLAAAAAVWTAFRAGPSEPAKALLLAATVLATPYAFVYDLPMLGTAIIWLVADCQHRGEAFDRLEVLVLELAAIFPIAMPGGLSRLPFAPIILSGFVAMIALHLRRRQRSSAPAVPLPLALPQ